MDTLIGRVPDNWDQARLGAVCDVLAGPFGGVRNVPSGVRPIAPKDIRGNRIVADDGHSIEIGVGERFARYLLAANDIVCVRTGDLGRQALVTESHVGWLLGTGCLRLRARDPSTARYIAYYLGHPMVHDWILRHATGSTIPSLSTETMRELPFVAPPLEGQVTIGEILGALDEKIAVHEQIRRTTAGLRDSLLHLLLTGSV